MYNFTKLSTIFLNNNDVSQRDIAGDEEKVKSFPNDIDNRPTDSRSNRSLFVRSFLQRAATAAPSSSNEKSSINKQEVSASGFVKASELTSKVVTTWRNANNLIELLILKTKKGHYRLFVEM